MRKTKLLGFPLGLILFFAFSFPGYAKDIYLSSSGNDTNSGLTFNAPVATLTKAFSLCGNGDVLHVTGIIDISGEISGSDGINFPGISLTIDGGDGTVSGFSGGGRTRILNIDSNQGSIIKNLSFTNGSSSISEGVALSVNNSNIKFENCNFHDNSGNRRASKGTVFVQNCPAVTFSSCVFQNNKVQFGGGLYINGGAVNILNTRIEDNQLSYSGSAGGGLYVLNCTDLLLQNSIIRNCLVNDEGGAIYLVEDGSVTNLVSNIRIEACLIADNSSNGTGGGAVSILNDTQGNNILLLLINTTVSGNAAPTSGQGGAFRFNSATSGSTVDMINCTIVGNKVVATENNGAGLFFSAQTEEMKKSFYNCIIESNVASMTPRKSSDLSFRYQAQNGKDLFIYKSYVGDIWNNGEIYTPVKENDNRIGYGLGEYSELATPYEDFIATQNSIPLEYNSSALTHGDATYLKNYGISTDQLGNVRKFENERCAVGALEIPTNPPVGVESHNYQHFIMNGQSLSTGHEAYPVSTENIPGNYMLGEQIWNAEGNRNLDQLNPLKATIAIGYPDLSESPLHGAVNHIRLKQQEVSPEIENRFIATSVGVSGQPIEALSKHSQVDNYYSNVLDALKYTKKIATATNSSVVCPAIFWLQGEWNYQGHGNGLTLGSKPTTDKDEYKKLMIQLKNDMQNDIQDRYWQDERPLFITYQVGAQYTAGIRLPIGMAQLEASNEYRDVICAGPVYQMTDVGGHLDGNGYRWYGELLGKVYYKTKIEGEDFKPLQPKRLQRDENDPQKVYITFHVPEPPMVFDEHTLKKVTDYGFTLYANNRIQTIKDIEIVKDSIIAITTNTDLSGGKIAVSYASSSTAGHGNLRDSDPYQAFFTYEDPDKKDADGNFVFPHGDKASLIPPSGEPKDENGNVIYGQPYPLYNFCVAFYYEIDADENEYVIPYFAGEPYVSASEIIMKEELSVRQAGKSFFVILPEAGEVGIELYDLSGKKITGFAGQYQFAGEKKQYALPSVPSGIYILKVNTARQTKTIKVML
ncbi:MAG: T9SS type A sorting domain-containing protein [Candidatus Azobacteroides sp.]|nr:T9SS type A sorting domain-containing protein [Candidatus Azobacteroides sp.]